MADASRRKRAGRKPPVIDFHAHVVVPEVFRFNRNHVVMFGFSKSGADRAERDPARRASANTQPEVWSDVGRRLAAMDKMGVDIQVLTASNVHQCTYWAPARKGLEMDRLSNDRIAATCAEAPDRLVGLATVPLQSPKLAAKELERAVKTLGLKGANISSNVEGKELGDESLRPFWEAAESLDVPVYVHPAGAKDPRFQRHLMWNSIGQPLEEAMALSSLIYDGVMDAHPKLKVVFSHGGGFLPFYYARVDRNYYGRAKRGRWGKIDHPPSAYLKRFYFDTCLYAPKMLNTLVDMVGASRLIMGSDYPVGDPDPVGFIGKAKGVSASARAAMRGGTAAKLLKLAA